MGLRTQQQSSELDTKADDLTIFKCKTKTRLKCKLRTQLRDTTSTACKNETTTIRSTATQTHDCNNNSVFKISIIKLVETNQSKNTGS